MTEATLPGNDLPEIVVPGESGSYPSPAAIAVRTGSIVRFSGIVGFDPDRELLDPGAAGPQARRALKTIESVLGRWGSSLTHLVHLRIYVTHREEIALISEVLDDLFERPWPPTTMVAIHALALPEIRVEIEAVAIVGQG